MTEKSQCYAEGLSRLIQVETISENFQTDVSKFLGFHQVLKKEFPHLFAVCEFEEWQGSFLMRWKGREEGPALLLMNHHDVVETSGQWQHEPFSGDIADGKVWGRGTLDTKGGLYCMLQAAEELVEEGFVPTYDVYFESANTEEVDGTGCQHFAKVLKDRKVSFFMSLDEGGMMMEEPIPGAKDIFAMVGVGEKNCVDLKFVAKGNAGHASTPGKKTPLVRLGQFMAEVEKSNLFEVQMDPTVAEMFRCLSTSMSGALAFLLGHPDAFKPLLCAVMPKVSGTANAFLRTTLAFTMASGSDGRNVMPSEAFVIGNMRVSHHQGDESSIAEVRKIASKYDISVEVLDPGISSHITDYRRKPFQLVKKTITELFPGVKTAPYIMTGASDSRYLSLCCQDSIRFTPFTISEAQLESIHGPNECVDISCLEPAVQFYKRLISNFAQECKE